MKRLALKQKASRTKQREDITKYKKQRNLVVKLTRETKFHYFNNLETSKNVDLIFLRNMYTVILR